MDKHIRKLKKLVGENLHNSRKEIINIFGLPSKKYDDDIWFYRRFRFSLLNEEIAFIFTEDQVVDIVLTQYFLWFEIKNVYYFEEQIPEYKQVCLICSKFI